MLGIQKSLVIYMMGKNTCMDNSNLIIGAVVLAILYIIASSNDDQVQMICTVVPITGGSTIYTCTKE